jgi:hypothetical protein
MAVRLSVLCSSGPLPPGRFLVLISVRGWVAGRVIMRLEELGQLKRSNDLIGDLTRDLPACIIVSQPTTLQLSQNVLVKYGNLIFPTHVFRGVKLTTHPQLVLRSRISGSIRPLVKHRDKFAFMHVFRCWPSLGIPNQIRGYIICSALSFSVSFLFNMQSHYLILKLLLLYLFFI